MTTKTTIHPFFCECREALGTAAARVGLEAIEVVGAIEPVEVAVGDGSTGIVGCKVRDDCDNGTDPNWVIS